MRTESVSFLIKVKALQAHYDVKCPLTTSQILLHFVGSDDFHVRHDQLVNTRKGSEQTPICQLLRVMPIIEFTNSHMPVVQVDVCCSGAHQHGEEHAQAKQRQVVDL